MNSELFIDILVKCFEFVGLTPVKRSPIRLEVLDAYGNTRVGEVYFINDTLNGLISIPCSEYGDLFEGLTNGMRIGFKEGLEWQINQG
mgnify:CR=1 FL=1